MPDSLNEHSKRPSILHLTGDFPDPINPDKTPVIARLIDLVGDRYEHRVISLNRQSPSLSQIMGLLSGSIAPVQEQSIVSIPRGFALNYLAPPKGVLHASVLSRLAEWIAQLLVHQDAVPSLVVGCKLTIEGLVAQDVAKRLSIPYAVIIQGNTDEKILSARPDLAERFRKVFHEAACVFAFAPWARRAVVQRLGERRGLTLDLPCPTSADTIHPPAEGGTTLISVFHLRNQRTKNLAGLAAAVRGLPSANRPCEVQIYGGGGSGETAECAAIVAGVPGMELMGPRTQHELGSIMNGAAALVMPSRRESFGLVFVEALFAGLPIIYPEGTSVDGYFDDLPFAMKVNARSKHDIGQAICHALANERELKSALAKWQNAGGLARFTRKAIAKTYAEGLDVALASHQMFEASRA